MNGSGWTWVGIGLIVIFGIVTWPIRLIVRQVRRWFQ